MENSQSYQEVAADIIRESIRSAIFIDDKALEPYGEKPNNAIDEEMMSQELYNHLRENGISLTVCRYGGKKSNNKGKISINSESETSDDSKNKVIVDGKGKSPINKEEETTDISGVEPQVVGLGEPPINSVEENADDSINKKLKCLLKGKDFAILDWKLDGQDSLLALEIMADIVENYPSLNYCVIYTSEPRLDDILEQILVYFSGINPDLIKDIKENVISDSDEETKTINSELKELLFILDSKEAKDKAKEIKSHHVEYIDGIESSIKKTYPDLNLCQCLKVYTIAISGLHIPTIEMPQPLILDREQNLVQINNTVFAILRKDAVSVENIINSFTSIITQNKYNFLFLTGSELNNVIRKKAPFMTSYSNRISLKAFGYQKKLKHAEDFNEFIRDVMMYDLSLKMTSSQLKLPDAVTEPADDNITEDELVRLNVLYNAAYDKDKKELSFGDVFRHEIIKEKEDGEDEKIIFYYMSVSPLCDYAQLKNDNNIYFVKGISIGKSTALKKKDEGYISYLNNDLIIDWNSDKRYVVPIPFTIHSKLIFNKQLELYRLEKDGEDFVKKKYIFEYIGTIKQNYAQRIANFAFTHCTRVGINFVGKQ